MYSIKVIIIMIIIMIVVVVVLVVVMIIITIIITKADSTRVGTELSVLILKNALIWYA